MRYFEMFAGVGGFGIGIKRAYELQEMGTESAGGPDPASGTSQHGERPLCIGFSEIDPHASAVLRYHYPNVKNYGDCTKINWSEVPDFDLLVGGSPCQDFSIAGKRAGLIGARSGLAYEYIRALEEKHPAHFIWENVRGVLSSNRGWDFAAILNQMAQAGYALQWQVLNAKHFGVPQNRERVFVIGTRSDLGSAREVFFEQGAGGQNLQELTREQSQGYRTYSTDGVSTTLAGQAGGIGAKTGLYQVAPTIRATHYKSGDNQPVIEGESRIRRLMPVECERLMSWPDGHTAKGKKEDETEYEVSDTQRYKMCGNGVVSEVVAAIVREMYNPPTHKAYMNEYKECRCPVSADGYTWHTCRRIDYRKLTQDSRRAIAELCREAQTPLPATPGEADK